MRDEAVPAPRYCFDVMRVASVVAKRLPQTLNVESQVCFFNECVGPQAPHQLVLFQYPAAVNNQDQQRLESLRGNRQRVALAKQNPLINIKSEFSEPIEVLAG